LACPLSRFQTTQWRSPLPRKYSQPPVYSTFRSLRFSSSPAGALGARTLAIKVNGWTDGLHKRTLGTFALATTEALAAVLRAIGCELPGGSFSELEAVVLRTPLRVKRSLFTAIFPHIDTPLRSMQENRVGPPDFVENAPQKRRFNHSPHRRVGIGRARRM